MPPTTGHPVIGEIDAPAPATPPASLRRSVAPSLTPAALRNIRMMHQLEWIAGKFNEAGIPISLEEVDTDEDGFLSTTEFRAIAAVLSVDNTSPGTASDLFNHLDHNNDGAVSKAEFLRSLDTAPTQSVDVKPSPVHPDPVTR